MPPLAGRLTSGARLGGFIYGTILVLSVIVAGARAYPHEPGHVAVLVATTCAVFWVAHVYSHALGESVELKERVSLRDFGRLAYREAAMLEAAVPPVAALLLGALGLFSERTSIWIAFGLGLTVLAVEGLVFARIEHLNRLATLAVVAVNLGLGVLLVGLKLAVSH